MKQREFAGTIIDINHQAFGLQQRDDKKDIAHPGMIGIFGGALEGNETPFEGALRELEEETSLRNCSLEKLGEYSITDTNRYGERIRKRLHVFSTVTREVSFEVMEGSLFIASFSIDLAVLPLSPGTLEMLRDYRLQRLEGVQ